MACWRAVVATAADQLWCPSLAWRRAHAKTLHEINPAQLVCVEHPCVSLIQSAILMLQCNMHLRV